MLGTKSGSLKGVLRCEDDLCAGPSKTHGLAQFLQQHNARLYKRRNMVVFFGIGLALS